VRTAASRTHVHLHGFITAHWRAPARGGRRGLDRGAGVRGHRRLDLTCTAPTRHEGRPQEHRVRREHGAWHGGASRGNPWFNGRSCNTGTC
jgi:hypothetical protein